MNVAIVVVCQPVTLLDEDNNMVSDEDEGYRFCELFGGQNRLEKAKKFVEEYFSVSNLSWKSYSGSEGDPEFDGICAEFKGTFPKYDAAAVDLAVYIYDESVK